MITAEKGQSKWQSRKKDAYRNVAGLNVGNKSDNKLYLHFAAAFNIVLSHQEWFCLDMLEINSIRTKSNISRSIYLLAHFSLTPLHSPWAAPALMMWCLLSILRRLMDQRTTDRVSEWERERDEERQRENDEWNPFAWQQFVDIKMSTRWSRCASCAFL